MRNLENSETLRQAKLANFRPGLRWQILLFWAVLTAAELGSTLLEKLVSLLAGAAGWPVASWPSWDALLVLFATAAGTGVVILYCRAIEKRPLRSLGCRKKNWLGEYALGFLLGAGMLCAAGGLAAACRAMTFQYARTISPAVFFLFLAGYVLQGMEEEFLLRGYLMVSLTGCISAPAAVCSSSIIFALLHTGNTGVTWLALVNLTLFGLFEAVLMLRRDNIWCACAVHSAWNFFQGNVLGVSVSGGETTASVWTASAGTRTWISGGDFGLEGGLAVTVVLAAALVLLLFLQRKGQANP